jgi:hypothetical protein
MFHRADPCPSGADRVESSQVVDKVESGADEAGSVSNNEIWAKVAPVANPMRRQNPETMREMHF